MTSVSRSGKFTITYPQEWKFVETRTGYLNDPSMIALLAYPEFMKTGIIGSVRLDVGNFITLSSVGDWGERIAAAKLDYRQVALDRFKIEGEEALLRKYGYNAPASPLQSSQPMECLDSYRMHATRAYILTLCVDGEDFAKLGPVFMQVIESLSIQD